MKHKGISAAVVDRLWRLIEMMKAGRTKTELIGETKSEKRNFDVDLKRLRDVGLQIKYSRAADSYTVEFPDSPVTVELPPREYFWLLYTAKLTGGSTEWLAKTLEYTAPNKANPIYAPATAHEMSWKPTPAEAPLVNKLSDAIARQVEVTLNYKPAGADKSELRIVQPYRLIHTPFSWFLAAYCKSRGDFRNFKLARIIDAVVNDDVVFQRRHFEITEHLGDCWWLRHDRARLGNPYQVRVKFRGDAADAMREYMFHPSQELEACGDGSLIATWRLSYLGEFASWLMQWLPNFEILEPTELRGLVAQRAAEYLQFDAGGQS